MIPYLLVKPPSGESFRLDLTQSQYTIGRLEDNNLVIPDTLVSRQHCKLEQISNRWHITDLHSRNGTTLRQSSGTTKFEIKVEPKAENDPGKVFLNNKDVICILGWELEFRDDNCTGIPEDDDLPEEDDSPEFVYNIAQHALYLKQRDSLVRLQPQPRPQLNLMLAYMIDRNKEEGQPVCCTFEKLKIAIWGVEDAHFRSNGDIRGLANELRQLFARYVPEEQAKALLETRSRQGYILGIKWQ